MWLRACELGFKSALVIGVGHTNINQFDLYMMSIN